MDCPICPTTVVDARGLATHFRHQDATHPVYKTWQEEQRWAGKVEGEDYIVCLECGHRAGTLARHLKAVHGITADQYRVKHGDVLIRATSVTERRREAIQSARTTSTAYDGFKSVVCPSCGEGHEVHKLSGVVPCPECKERAVAAHWEGKSEPDDFVVCLECGYRAENLTSHIQNAHPGYRERHPDAYMVALGSAVRDKSALKGRRRSPEFKQAIREAKTIGLTQGDFEPYLEADGTVDHRRAMEGLMVAWPTLKRYMDDLGLSPTDKYIRQRQAERVVTLTVEGLEAFKLKNGKVSVGQAARDMGYCFRTVKRECDRLGLPTFHRRIRQTLCLDAVSEALGGLDYAEEWKSWRFTNPPTGHRFRFDGYFPDVGLVVEFQGHQHYTFPNAFMVDESYRGEWEAMVERDRIKRELIEAAPDLLYLEIREDEPFTDEMYLRGRLAGLGQ